MQVTKNVNYEVELIVSWMLWILDFKLYNALNLNDLYKMHTINFNAIIDSCCLQSLRYLTPYNYQKNLICSLQNCIVNTSNNLILVRTYMRPQMLQYDLRTTSLLKVRRVVSYNSFCPKYFMHKILDPLWKICMSFTIN